MSTDPDDIRHARRSGILHWDDGALPDVPVRAYKADDGSFAGVLRRLLAAPDTAGFDVRYFELEPGGYTSLERHRHVHVVVCMRGSGVAVLDDASHPLGPGDVVTVAPDCVHRFRNAGAAPFGFLCIVDRDRDRPVPVKGD